MRDGTYYIRGQVSLSDLTRYQIILNSPSETITTIGGYVFSKRAHLPERGEVLVDDGYSMRVEDVIDNRVTAVILTELN